MFRSVLCVLFIAFASAASAQDIKGIDYKVPLSYKGGEEINESVIRKPDSLDLPPVNSQTGTPNTAMACYPYYGFGGFNDWNLHTGMNTTIDMSVMGGIGRHSYPGIGFGTNISMMYAKPLSKKLSLAIGGYMSRLSWGANSYNDVGLSGVLGYTINDKMNLSVYGQKSLTNPRIPFPMNAYGNLGDKFGAMFQYKPTSSMSFSVSVESSRYNAGNIGFPDGTLTH